MKPEHSLEVCNRIAGVDCSKNTATVLSETARHPVNDQFIVDWPASDDEVSV
jgi:hypothetical protein